MAIRERDVEKYFVAKVIKAGGITRKMQWISGRNAPDRIVFLNGIHLAELKSPQGELSAGQKREIAKLVEHSGETIYILHDFYEVDWFIEQITHPTTAPIII